MDKKTLTIIENNLIIEMPNNVSKFPNKIYLSKNILEYLLVNMDKNKLLFIFFVEEGVIDLILENKPFTVSDKIVSHLTITRDFITSPLGIFFTNEFIEKIHLAIYNNLGPIAKYFNLSFYINYSSYSGTVIYNTSIALNEEKIEELDYIGLENLMRTLRNINWKNKNSIIINNDYKISIDFNKLSKDFYDNMKVMIKEKKGR